MRGNEGFQFTPADMTDSATFTLRGGKYMVANIAGAYGTSTLKVLGPDGSTYLTVGTSTTFAANGVAFLDLPPGQYKFVNASVTGISQSVTRIPND